MNVFSSTILHACVAIVDFAVLIKLKINRIDFFYSTKIDKQVLHSRLISLVDKDVSESGSLM